MKQYVVWAVGAVLVGSGCNWDNERAGSSSEAISVMGSTNIAFPFNAGQFQAETSAASVQPGKGMCPNGAVVVGYNDGGNIEGQPSNMAGYLRSMNPTDPSSWTNHPGTELTQVAAAETNVRQTYGDPSVVSTSSGRLYYVTMGSTANVYPQAFDSIVVFRSDNCGMEWHASAVQVNPGNVDHPSAYVDSNGTLYITYITNAFSHPQNFVFRTTDGIAFTSPKPIASGSDSDQFPQLASLPGDSSRLFAVWAHEHYPPLTTPPQYTWYIAMSQTQGESWTTLGEVYTAGVLDHVGGNRVSGSPRNTANPSFIIGANGHCIVAIPYYNQASDSQRIAVRESTDGVGWTTTLDVALQGVSKHDAFNPVLVRNQADTGDSHVVLAWYDTRDDSSTPGKAWGVYAISSNQDAAAGHWDAVPIRLRDTATPFAPHFPVPDGDYFGDYIGGTAFQPVGGGTPQYLFPWMDSRGSTSTTLFGAWALPTM